MTRYHNPGKLLWPLLMLTGCHSAMSAPAKFEPQGTWALIWQDEFNGAKLDLTKWSFERNCFGGGNDEQQCYTNRAQNAFVSDGLLHIVARRESFTGPALQDDAPGYANGGSRTLPYTSARLRTLGKGDWKYGRFEIRAKLPSGQGTWPAIWMLPSTWQYGAWAASGEIDIMEAVNLNSASDADDAKPGDLEQRVHGTLHYGAVAPNNVYSGMGYHLPGNASPAAGFHTYAVEWQQGEIRWYVDAVHYATQTSAGWYSLSSNREGATVLNSGDAPFDQRFHLILNLALGGNWAGKVNDSGIDDGILPQQMLVDYVRVYRCEPAAESGAGCASRGDGAVLVPGHQPAAARR